MNTIFYIGMFMTLFILSIITLYGIWKDKIDSKLPDMDDIVICSIILSLGIVFMYYGTLG